MDHTATITLDQPLTADDAEAIVDQLAGYSPVASNDSHQVGQIIISFPATQILQATTTIAGVITHALAASDLNHSVTGLEVRTSDDYDRRLETATIPELVSVPEAAETLAITRQAALKLTDTGTLPSRRVGARTIVTSRAAVEHLVARRTKHHEPSPPTDGRPEPERRPT